LVPEKELWNLNMSVRFRKKAFGLYEKALDSKTEDLHLPNLTFNFETNASGP